MTKLIAYQRTPVEYGLYEFSLDQGHNIFLSYTHQRQHGPGIVRTGRGAPFMNLIGGEPGTTTTHPFGIRLGTWLVQSDLREAELEEASIKLEKALANNDPPEAVEG